MHASELRGERRKTRLPPNRIITTIVYVFPGFWARDRADLFLAFCTSSGRTDRERESEREREREIQTYRERGRACGKIWEPS